MPRSLPPSSRTSASTSNPALPALFARSVKSEIITWLSSTTPTASAARCPPPTSLRPSTVSSKSCGATAAATSIPKTPGSSSSVWPSPNSKPDAGAASPPPSKPPSISSTPSFSHDSRAKNESLRHKILDKCRRLLKRLHQTVQMAAQLRDRLRAHRLTRQDRHHPSHLSRRDAAQKRFPNQQHHFLRPPLKPLQASRVFPYRSPQNVSFRSRTKCWNCSVIGVTFLMGCKSPFHRIWFFLTSRTNLHPPHFYTHKITSPGRALIFR